MKRSLSVQRRRRLLTVHESLSKSQSGINNKYTVIYLFDLSVQCSEIERLTKTSLKPVCALVCGSFRFNALQKQIPSARQQHGARDFFRYI